MFRLEISTERFTKLAIYTYSNGWSLGYKENRGVLDLKKARTAHEKRKKYTVLVGNPDRPTAVIDFINDFIPIAFLDKNLRSYLDFAFYETVPGRLFLSEVAERRFVGDTDKVAWGRSYIYETDGSLSIDEENFDNNILDSKKYSGVDVSGNWDVYPEFGNYESLLVLDRHPRPELDIAVASSDGSAETDAPLPGMVLNQALMKTDSEEHAAPITYCKDWSAVKKRHGGVLAREVAQAAHENGRKYTVVSGDPDNPSAVIAFDAKDVSVMFLDAQRRTYLRYQFDAKEPGKLFLHEAMYREFIGNGNKVGRRIQYVFREDGGRYMKDEDFWALTTKQDFGSGVDLSANWEDYPAFGDYAALLVKNRPLALV